jgi:exodeoxyribonuclease VII small subunit
MHSAAKKETSFEEAFTHLEKILEKMNSGKTSLDDSLKLFEEADALIFELNKRLNHAEQKIEVLLKRRDGTVELGDNGKPQQKNFDLEQEV